MIRGRGLAYIYVKEVCDIRPQKTDTHWFRITYGVIWLIKQEILAAWW